MIDWKTKSSYDILEEFSKISSYSSFDKYAPTWTPRLNKILEILNSSNISHEIKHFKVPGFERDFTNIYVSFKKDINEPGILFLAHHDISNEHSENCQDNTASVCHLLEMVLELNDNPPSIPIHIAIVDSEEHVNPYCCGSQVLSEDIKNGNFGEISACINLELTGLGKHIWVSSFERFEDFCDPFIEKLNAHKVQTPYNDAAVLSLHGVPAMCIGILDDRDIEIALNDYGYPHIWGLCHRKEDTFDKISKEDMVIFQQKLLSICL